MSILKKAALQKDLLDKKSAVRRKAIVEIGKNKIQELGDQLYQSYLEEKKDERTWQTQVEMIRSLGLIDYKNALKEIEVICTQDEPDSMITIIAAEAYVRLKRKSLNDAEPAIHLITNSHHSVIQGCYNAIGYDKMLPDDNEIKQLIELSYSPKNIVSDHFDDPRYGLAAAAAGWKKELVQEFLLNCLELNDEPLKYVAANSLKGKYVKLR